MAVEMEQDIVTLSQILDSREKSLEEIELWAVCQECCEALINFDVSSQDYSMLCITPDSLVFDSYGNVSLRALDHEPNSMFLSRDAVDLMSSKDHVFSLGMSLLYASTVHQPQRHLSSRLQRLLSSMTSQDSKTRLALDDVIRYCDRELKGLSSSDICSHLSALARSKTPSSNMSSAQSYNEDWDTDNDSVFRASSRSSKSYNLHRPGSLSDHSASPSSGRSSSHNHRLVAGTPEQQKSSRLHNIQDKQHSPKTLLLSSSSLDRRRSADYLYNESSQRTPKNHGRIVNGHYSDSESRRISLQSVDSATDITVHETSPLYAVELQKKTPVITTATRTGKLRSGQTYSPLTTSLLQKQYISTDLDADINFDQSDDLADTLMLDYQSSPSLLGYPDSDTMNSSQNTATEKVTPLFVNQKFFEQTPEREDQLSLERKQKERKQQYQQKQQYQKQHNNILHSPLLSSSSSHNSPPTTADSKTRYDKNANERKNQTPILDVTPVTQVTPRLRGANVRAGSGLRERMESRTSCGRDSVRSVRTDRSERMCESVLSQSTLADRSVSRCTSASAFPEGKTLQEILEKLGCNLEEEEIWAIARECVLTVEETQTQPYMTVETVLLLDNGQAAFIPIGEDTELTGILPPEYEQDQPVSEKMCVFSLAATLWAVADHALSDNQEPSLSQQLEDLLMSMTTDDPDDRPSFAQLLQALDDVEPTLSMTSEQICWRLLQDIYNIKDDGKMPPGGSILDNSICVDDIENDPESFLEYIPTNYGAPTNIQPTNHDRESPDEEELTPRMDDSGSPEAEPVGTGAVELANLSDNQKTTLNVAGSAFQRTSAGINANIGSPLVVPVKKVEGLQKSATLPSAFTSYATHFTPIPSDSPKKGGSTSTPVTTLNVGQKNDKNPTVKNRPPIESETVAMATMDNGEVFRDKETTTSLNSSSSDNQNTPHQELSSHSSTNQNTPHEMTSQLGQTVSGVSTNGRLETTSQSKEAVNQNLDQALSGFPVSVLQSIPFHLQQDPVTGLFAIVPVKTGSLSSTDSQPTEHRLPYELHENEPTIRRSIEYEQQKSWESQQSLQRQESKRSPRKAESLRSDSSHENRRYDVIQQETSPSLSRDSGVSAGNVGGKATLMERLLSSEQSGRQVMVKRIVGVIRDEFSTHGFMDNTAEDLMIAEYILSLVKLKYGTFASAIFEKYDDYFWSEELLYSLYFIVNGRPPSRQHTYSDPQQPLSSTAHVLSVDEPAPFDPDLFSRRNADPKYKPMYMSQRLLPTEPKIRARSHAHSYTESSDSTDSEHRDRKRRSKKRPTNVKSASMTNVAHFDSSLSGADLTLHSSRESLHEPNAYPTINSPTEVKPVVIGKVQSVVSRHNSISSSKSGSVKSILLSPSNGVVSPSNERTFTSVTSLGSSVASSNPSSVASSNGNHRNYDKQSVMFYAFDTDYTAAARDLSATQDLEMIHTRSALENIMAEVEQRVAMETKMRRKSLSFHQKLQEACEKATGGKGADQRNMMTKVYKQVTEMSERVNKLDAIRRHLEVLYADQWGVEHVLLASLAQAPPSQPLNLLPNSASLLIQFQTCKEKVTIGDMPSVHAGTPLGLMSLLFAKTSISCGYVHEFFLCYRYFAKPKQVLKFIVEKYVAAVRSPVQQQETCEKVQTRVIDVLSYWMQAYYNLDFRNSSDLSAMLAKFVHQRKKMHSQMDKCDPMYENLYNLFEECYHGNHTDLTSGAHAQLADIAEDENENLNKKYSSLPNMLKMPNFVNRQKTKVVSWQQTKREALLGDGTTGSHDDLTAFSLMDYSPVQIAEQLTLLEQTLFHQSHPVLFMDSKSHGVNVAMAASSATNKATTLASRTNVWGGPSETSLFLGTCPVYTIVDRMLEHGHSIGHWASAEILSSSSSKSQLLLLTKFIQTARHCLQLRNYATAFSILDGLENVVVRQLPIWRSLPSKCVSAMEELSQMKATLKHSSPPVNKGEAAIPAILLFLLQVQQSEHGAFTLANGMYKWGKIRKISRLVDRIRVYMTSRYDFPYNGQLVTGIQAAMAEYRECDLHTIASQHLTNIQKLPSAKLPDAFRKMRKKFQGKDG